MLLASIIGIVHKLASDVYNTHIPHTIRAGNFHLFYMHARSAIDINDKLLGNFQIESTIGNFLIASLNNRILKSQQDQLIFVQNASIISDKTAYAK